MTPRLCYATDLPRGALLVEHAITVVDLTVEPVEGVVNVRVADGETLRFAMSDRVLIDEDTTERGIRLAAARALLWEPES